MFSGSNDFSTFYNNSADWLIQSGATRGSEHFFLLYLNEAVAPFANQFKNNQSLCIFKYDDTTLVDNLVPPCANSNSLHTKIPAFSYRASTLGANPALQNVWNYMLNSSIKIGIKVIKLNDEMICVFSNPTSSLVTIEISPMVQAKIFKIINSAGEIVFIENIANRFIVNFDFTLWPKGLFIICVDNTVKKIVINWLYKKVSLYRRLNQLEEI